jgi:4-aminobutyrate aminotransferase-like enzyme
MAVMDVLEAERLPENALATGRYLTAKLEALKSRHELIGDVRGAGLFLGVELVRDRETLEPATTEAGEVVNVMREAGVLASTDGPFDNAIKIKPPMVFGVREVDIFADELDRAIGALARRA